MTHIRQAGITIFVLIFTLLLFESSRLDIWVQHWLYDAVNHHWLWSKAEPVTRFLLYDGIKGLLIIFALCLFIALVFFRRMPPVQSRLPGIRIVLLSLLVVPMVVGGLKATTDVACPAGLQLFGGSQPYTRLFETYSDKSRPQNRQRCFPAGHASGGFALLSLCFLFREKRNQRVALGLAVTVGWLMGGYKMVIGDHFLSHTLVTMELAWLFINLIAFFEYHGRAVFAAIDNVPAKIPI